MKFFIRIKSCRKADTISERTDSMNDKALHEQDGTKIYYPKKLVSPMWETNVITDNKTDQDGNVIIRSDQNVICAKKWVDANHK